MSSGIIQAVFGCVHSCTWITTKITWNNCFIRQIKSIEHFKHVSTFHVSLGWVFQIIIILSERKQNKTKTKSNSTEKSNDEYNLTKMWSVLKTINKKRQTRWCMRNHRLLYYKMKLSVCIRVCVCVCCIYVEMLEYLFDIQSYF